MCGRRPCWPRNCRGFRSTCDCTGRSCDPRSGIFASIPAAALGSTASGSNLNPPRPHPPPPARAADREGGGGSLRYRVKVRAGRGAWERLAGDGVTKRDEAGPGGLAGLDADRVVEKWRTYNLSSRDAALLRESARRERGETRHSSMLSISDTATEMVNRVFPEHAGAPGQIHGGRMMQWIATCGTIAASRVARGNVVLGAMDDIDFLHPVKVGEVAVLRAQVEY